MKFEILPHWFHKPTTPADVADHVNSLVRTGKIGNLGVISNAERSSSLNKKHNLLFKVQVDFILDYFNIHEDIDDLRNDMDFLAESLAIQLMVWKDYEYKMLKKSHDQDVKDAAELLKTDVTLESLNTIAQARLRRFKTESDNKGCIDYWQTVSDIISKAAIYQ